MDGVPVVEERRLRVVVLADLSDPTWSGQLESRHREERAFLYTDVFLGHVRFMTLGGLSPTLLPRYQPSTGVFGCLDMVASGIASSDTRKVVPDYRGNQLVVRVDGGVVRLSDDESEIAAERDVFARRLGEAFGDAMALVEAVYPAGTYPPYLDEVRARIAGLT